MCLPTWPWAVNAADRAEISQAPPGPAAIFWLGCKKHTSNPMLGSHHYCKTDPEQVNMVGTLNNGGMADNVSIIHYHILHSRLYLSSMRDRMSRPPPAMSSTKSMGWHKRLTSIYRILSSLMLGPTTVIRTSTFRMRTSASEICSMGKRITQPANESNC